MKRYAIGTKLIGAFGAMFALALLLTGTSLWIVSNMQENFDNASRVTAKKLVLSGTLDTLIGDMFATQRGLIMNSFAGRHDRLGALKSQFDRDGVRYIKTLDEMSPLLVTTEGKQIVNSLREGFDRWKPLFDQIYAQSSARNAAEAIATSDLVAPMYESLGKSATILSDLNLKLVQNDQAKAEVDSGRARTIAITLLIATLGLCAGVFYMVRQITRQLRSVALGTSESAEQVASASGQVSSSSQALAQGSSEQAASLEETSASAEEITSMTRKNADNSREAAELMTQVDRHVSAGNGTLDQMVSSMQSINESSEKVSKIIKVIDEIAFQTNILALNAAVEAARAGEAGMGFAVVADEVRNLAQRSAQAAKDTSSLIEESISRSKEGSTKLENVAGVMRSITDSATKVKTLVDEVNLGSQEQARGIEQIAKAIAQMDKVTQQNAANAEESASASEEMSAQAESMKATAAQLLEMVNGTGNAHAAVSTHPARATHRQRDAKKSRPARQSHNASVRSTTDAPAIALDDFQDF